MQLGSANFSFLRSGHPRLEALGELAERYFPDDPNTSLLKARQFGELLSQIVAARLGVYVSDSDTFVDTIRRLRDEAGVDRRVIQLFHQLRTAGNEAAHAMGGDHGSALSALKVSHQLAVWFYRGLDRHADFNPGPFTPPKSPPDESEALRNELQELRQLLAAHQSTVKEEAARRFSAEELARKEAEERASWEKLAQETEAEKLALLMQLRELQAVATAAPVEEKQLALQQANEAADGIHLDERDTRRLIDAQLRAAGWDADSDSIHYAKGVRPQKGKNLAIAEWRTTTGPVDYALFVGLQCIGLVEAKRKNKDVSAAIDQAKRYGQGFLFEGGAESVGGPWGEQRVPFLFASNGRPYLKQIETRSGIWFWDARKATNLRRAVQGWYTPQGLLELLRQDETEAHRRLEQESFNYGFKLREFQEKAIRTVESKLGEGQRNILLAMATGTGKTKTCIALVYRLLKTKRFRRILFLVDRTALGEQAANAFKDTRMESLQTFADIFGLKELGDINPEPETKVHISTIQAQVKRILFTPEDEAPPVDRYDCIVVDECHRGYLLDREMSDAEISFRDQGDYISKYRRVLDHYDAAKIGLTATPALHTVEIFGAPAFTYGYREAVLDGWLVDHEPPVRIVTALAKEGIQWDQGDPVELLDAKTGKVDLLHAPDEIRVEIEGFNKKVVTKDFNRVVCEELANHIDPTLEGKTLIFCATDQHADIVVDQLKQAFAAKYGEVDDDAVQKITGAADKPRQRIRTFRNERLPNVAVTVDLLTTGIDVPPISNLVFIRRVNSRILYEQMLGRGTRLCPEIDKECFRIYDAVDLYSTLENLTDMKPVVKDPDDSFAKLAAALENATEEEAKRVFQEQILAKLRRRLRRMGEANRQAVETVTGKTPEALLQQVAQGTAEQAADVFRKHALLIEILDRTEEGAGGKQLISHHEDSLHIVEHGYGAGQKPKDFLDGFSAFLKANMNEIPALLAVTQRPRALTRQQLRELALLLEREGYREIALQTAWRDATNQNIAAGIIGFIRRAALGDPLLPYADRVKKAMAKTLASRPWSAPQRQWLERIGRQLEVETVVDREALDRGQFAAQGGFNRINKVFDGRLEEILGEISEALWKKIG